MNGSGGPGAIQVVPMTLEDIPRVLLIDQLSFPLPWSSATYRYELTQNANSHFFVALAEQARGASAASKGMRAWLNPANWFRPAPAAPPDPERPVVGYGGFWYILDEAHISTIAVHPDWQGIGLGKAVVRGGVEWLAGRRTTVIGLETMPRTMDNIGFYSTLGFIPARLTITVTLDAARADGPVAMLSRLPEKTREDLIAQCRDLTMARIPGYDYTREIRLTSELGLGDTLLTAAAPDVAPQDVERCTLFLLGAHLQLKRVRPGARAGTYLPTL